jgi:hypothetical protein
MSVKEFAMIGDGNALNHQDGGKTFVVKRTVDCSANNVAQADVVKLMNVPANTFVKQVIVNVRTAEGGTLTLDVGDHAIANDAEVDKDGYHDGLNGNAQAVVFTRAQLAENTTTIAYAEGKFYAAATAYIGALFNNAADAAVIDFIIECVDCR